MRGQAKGKRGGRHAKSKKMSVNPFFSGTNSMKPEPDMRPRKPLSSAKKRAMAMRPI